MEQNCPVKKRMYTQNSTQSYYAAAEESESDEWVPTPHYAASYFYISLSYHWSISDLVTSQRSRVLSRRSSVYIERRAAHTPGVRLRSHYTACRTVWGQILCRNPPRPVKVNRSDYNFRFTAGRGIYKFNSVLCLKFLYCIHGQSL